MIKNNNPFLSTETFSLTTDTNYQLEFYYNKANYYGCIRIKNLDTASTDKFEYYDISVNGGFNVTDGYLSII